MSLFAELKRRNVIRVALVYLAAAWLVLQMGDVIFPVLQVPDWSMRLLTGLLALGFPVAVVLAWICTSRVLRRWTGRLPDLTYRKMP